MVESAMSIAFLARSSDFQLRPCRRPSTNSVLGADIQVLRSNASVRQVMSIGGWRSGVVEILEADGSRTLFTAQDT